MMVFPEPKDYRCDSLLISTFRDRCRSLRQGDERTANSFLELSFPPLTVSKWA